MSTLIVMGFIIGGGLGGFLFVGVILSHISPKFRKWFDRLFWGGEE